MKHHLIVHQRLVSILSNVPDNIKQNILETSQNLAHSPLTEYARAVNTSLRNTLRNVTCDSEILSRGEYPLSLPESYDAVAYWIQDLSDAYVPMLELALSKRYETNT